MHDLKVIGVEDGALVAATEQGQRFRIVINEVLLSHLRPPKPAHSEERRLSPREVQAHIRSGLSAEEVADLTGVGAEYVRRFEGPVLAEREHIVGAALSVPVLSAIEVPGGDEPTFGAAIAARLEGLAATGERWTSWKDPGDGWIVKLSFTAATIDHDARWSYEPKKHTLAPLNQEAITLSKQGELPHGMIPRLRAVESDSRFDAEPPTPDESRFDSGAFRFRQTDGEDPKTIALLEPAALSPRHPSAASQAAINRGAGSEENAPSNQTADLLEALRKRRGQRESAPEPENADADEGDHDEHRGGEANTPLDFGSIAPEGQPDVDTAQPTDEKRSSGRSKRGRASMPSWDEIVFGARSDSDD
ncbi:septation protein SepH [Paramicrobacterium fandaimingii]|uniref:septation protein SepH n=1 Tax=Paramicrobacterium fandaimingii TaxID=2708079 RepID=UPI00141E94EA|nr:septation protein SepH [Microbacterium fandaimingii]